MTPPDVPVIKIYFQKFRDILINLIRIKILKFLELNFLQNLPHGTFLTSSVCKVV